MYPASTVLTAQSTKIGMLLYNQSVIYNQCVTAYAFLVNDVTRKALVKLAGQAIDFPEYYMPLPEYVKKYPAEKFSLNEYSKAYGPECLVFDNGPDSAFVTEVKALVDYFEHKFPNPAVLTMPLKELLSNSRSYAIRRKDLTIAGSALVDGVIDLTYIGAYKLVRIISNAGASSSLEFFYGEDPNECAEKLTRFIDKDLLLFMLISVDATPLVLFEADKRPDTPGVDILELPQDRYKMAWYVLSDGAHKTPEKKSEQALHLDEIRSTVPPALDFLANAFSLPISMKEFCKTRGGQFSYVEKNPRDPYATFFDVNCRGRDFVLPPGYIEATFHSLAVQGADKVLLPRVVAEDATFDMCKSVSLELAKISGDLLVRGGDYEAALPVTYDDDSKGSEVGLKRLETKLVGSFEVAGTAEFSDVRFFNVKLNCERLVLRGVRGLQFQNSGGDRLVTCRELDLTADEQPSMATWKLPGVYELTLDTLDHSPYVLANLEQQVPNLKKLTLKTGMLGQKVVVPEVDVLAGTLVPLPDIEARTVYVLVNSAWKTPLKSETLRLRALPLQESEQPYEIVVPREFKLMYAGAEKLLSSRRFAECVLVHPDNILDWVGAELVAPQIFIVWEAKTQNPTVLFRFIANMQGAINLILIGEASVPAKSTWPANVNVWRIRENARKQVNDEEAFDVRDWKDFNELRGKLDPLV